jgi:hypothetical protein
MALAPVAIDVDATELRANEAITYPNTEAAHIRKAPPRRHCQCKRCVHRRRRGTAWPRRNPLGEPPSPRPRGRPCLHPTHLHPLPPTRTRRSTW